MINLSNLIKMNFLKLKNIRLIIIKIKENNILNIKFILFLMILFFSAYVVIKIAIYIENSKIKNWIIILNKKKINLYLICNQFKEYLWLSIEIYFY